MEPAPPDPPDPEALAWSRAVRDEAIAARLDEIHRDASARIAQRGPVCWASGRCCNFEAYGHRLYVTGLEAALALLRADQPDITPHPPSDTLPDRRSLPILDAHAADRLIRDTHAARRRGGCPFQRGNLCGIHHAKPLACRVFFCDRTAQAWQHELHEHLLDAVRTLHNDHAIPYCYAEWRGLLDRLALASLPPTIAE